MKNGITIRIWTNSIQMVDDKRFRILQNLPFLQQNHQKITACDSIISMTANAMKTRDIIFFCDFAVKNGKFFKRPNF